jgi:hypothetical protein
MPVDWTWERELEAALSSHDAWLTSPFLVRWFSLNADLVAAVNAEKVAAAMSQLRSASLLAASADLAVTAGIPVAAWVGVFVALGAPYMQARAIVTEENFKSGFSQGYVTRALKWTWSQTTQLFFKFAPGAINPFDESLSYFGANAYNDGLKAGFASASLLPDALLGAFLRRLRGSSPSTRAHSWDRLDRLSYVIELASAGRRTGAFEE